MLTLLEDGQFAVDMMFGNFVCLEFEYFPNFFGSHVCRFSYKIMNNTR